MNIHYGMVVKNRFKREFVNYLLLKALNEVFTGIPKDNKSYRSLIYLDEMSDKISSICFERMLTLRSKQLKHQGNSLKTIKPKQREKINMG